MVCDIMIEGEIGEKGVEGNRGRELGEGGGGNVDREMEGMVGIGEEGMEEGMVVCGKMGRGRDGREIVGGREDLGYLGNFLRRDSGEGEVFEWFVGKNGKLWGSGWCGGELLGERDVIGYRDNVFEGW